MLGTTVLTFDLAPIATLTSLTVSGERVILGPPSKLYSLSGKNYRVRFLLYIDPKRIKLPCRNVAFIHLFDFHMTLNLLFFSMAFSRFLYTCPKNATLFTKQAFKISTRPNEPFGHIDFIKLKRKWQARTVKFKVLSSRFILNRSRDLISIAKKVRTIHEVPFVARFLHCTKERPFLNIVSIGGFPNENA